jgi:hypothetical protein
MITCLILLVLGLVCIGLLIVFSAKTVRLKLHQEQTRVLAMSIGSAIKSYFAEYERLPFPEGADAESVPTRSDELLVSGLSAVEKKLPMLNPKRINFLPEMRDATRGGYGMKLGRDGQPAIVDSWGEEFYIVLDTNGDGSVPNRTQRQNRGHCPRRSSFTRPDRTATPPRGTTTSCRGRPIEHGWMGHG